MVFKRVTVWAENFKILQIIICPIPVNVVQYKYAWVFIVLAPVAELYHISSSHPTFYGRIISRHWFACPIRQAFAFIPACHPF
jgi:hypothetical protein